MSKALRRILCVDDEPDILEIVDLCLGEIEGLEITTMQDVQQAIDNIHEISPDLILLDVMMPRMNGVEAMARIRGTPGYECTPVVLMTARIQPNEVSAYKASGATDVVPKPFDPTQLAEQIQAIWSAQNVKH